MQIGVRFERFDDTLNLLDQASSQGIELDVVIINTIMHKACEKVALLSKKFQTAVFIAKYVNNDTSQCTSSTV